MSSHRLEIDYPSEPIRIEGDLSQLAQALSKLLCNAAKFMPQPGVIAVNAGQRGEQAFITVFDHGVGFSKEFEPHLFELFSQAGNALLHAQGGLGIGLAIAHEIVSLHGGSIAASSKGVGCGSEFTIYLPLASAPASDAQAKQPGAAIASNQDFRILLIDDNPDANESMGSLLKLLGYDVQTASDAESGLQLAAEFKPHLVLSDIGLPGMDGYQLAPALRQTAGERKMVLAAATGYGLASDRQRSQAAGFDYHLVKPLEADALLEFVAQQRASY
jgi:CheY-like chemotaxis protein